jgi:hypothetical protein
MMMDTKRKKVVSPIEKDGKTYWRPIGSAFVNKDNSINVYLDSVPLNWDGKLQVRDWDERQPRDAAPTQFNLRPLNGGAETARVDETPF